MNSFRRHAGIFLSTCAYTGYSRWMPGTLGTLWGIPAAWGLSKLSAPYAALCIIAFTLISILASAEAVRIFGQKDPQRVVIDEVCGYITAFFLVPFNMFNVILLFALFRFFDIVKPFPVGIIDRKVAGGPGVVLDDIAAGILANILGRAILWSINAFAQIT